MIHTLGSYTGVPVRPVGFMSDKIGPNPSELARQRRQSAALRANLKRRKEQAKEKSKQQARDRSKQAESEKPSASTPTDRSE